MPPSSETVLHPAPEPGSQSPWVGDPALLPKVRFSKTPSSGLPSVLPPAPWQADLCERSSSTCAQGAIIHTRDRGRTWTVVPLRCKRWSCDYCSKRLAAKWAAKISRAKPTKFITITVDPALHGSPSLAYESLVKTWSKFVSWWRKERGDLEYCRLVEIQPGTGMPHFHILARSEFIPQKLLSSWFSRAGVGTIQHVRQINDSKGAAYYASKYTTKSSDSLKGLATGIRVASASRGYFEPKADSSDSKDTEVTWFRLSWSNLRSFLDWLIDDSGYIVTDESPSLASSLQAPDDPRKVVSDFDVYAWLEALYGEPP